MPRFLDTLTGEFVWKDDPQDVIYAILSHTWRSTDLGGEQSYVDVRRLQDEVRTSASSIASDAPDPLGATIFSHPDLSDKIKGICEVARKAGYRLVWDDTCCIDKSSSAELTEAINSMYELYRLADVCYVYLEDVRDGDDPYAEDSDFQGSRWHKRGWTLQELIAPKRAVFLTRTWRILGTKFGLASRLADITGVGFDILTGRATVSSVSIAQRMSWAAHRETTRVEDRAYSLMGIFGVHMPTIYGEGACAFLRLQEEILRTIPDQSVFVWGNLPAEILPSAAGPDAYQGPRYRDSVQQRSYPSICAHGLLPSSPEDFEHSAKVNVLSPWQFASRLGVREQDLPSLDYVFTPQGVRTQLLCFDPAHSARLLQSFHAMLRSHSQVCDECLRLTRPHLLALLPCEDSDSNSLYVLPLCRPESIPDSQRGFLIATHVQCADRYHAPFRTVLLSKDALAEALEPSSLVLTGGVTVLRHHSYPAKTLLKPGDIADLQPRDHTAVPIGSIPFFTKHPVAFQFDPHCEAELGTLGYTLSPLCANFTRRRTGVRLTLSTTLDSDPHHPLWKRASFVQSIQIRLTVSPNRRYGYSMDTCFNVANYIVRTSPGSTPASEDPPSMEEVPSVDASGNSYATSFKPDLYADTTPRGGVLAAASFAVYADVDCDKGVSDVRFLHLALKLPLRGSAPSRSSAHTGRQDQLWVSVELSDRYCCAKPASKEELPDQVIDSIGEGDMDLDIPMHDSPSANSLIPLIRTGGHDIPEGGYLRVTRAQNRGSMIPPTPTSPHSELLGPPATSRWEDDNECAACQAHKEEIGALRAENIAMRTQLTELSAQIAEIQEQLGIFAARTL